MKKALKAAALALALAAAPAALATPSTVVWTPATTYTQPYLVPHLTYDSYVAEKGMLQNTYGLTLGVLPYEKVQAEVGFDLFYPGNTFDFLQLNGKVTVVEGALADWSPALSVGVANWGFKKDVSDYGLAYAVLSKGLGSAGTLGVGGYLGTGSKVLWTGSGSKEDAGLMASYTSPDFVVDLPGLKKVTLGIDYASGKNWFGAVGAAASFYFTDSVALLTGPVFFLDSTLYKNTYGTDFMWTAQIDVDFDLRKPAPAAK